MYRSISLVAACLLSVAWAQYKQEYTTPVPILKQINRHNDDGSYSYGYEGADGSFKIETKYPTGEVYGKYGYVDDSGQVREVEYGASRRGFEPSGNDINVAPPTLTVTNTNNLGPNEEDDGQYREDPSIYYKNEEYNRPRPQQQSYSQPPQQWTQHQQQWSQPQQPAYNPPQPVYNPPQQTYNPPQQTYNQPQQTYNQPQQQWSQPQQPVYNPPQQTYNPPQQQWSQPARNYNPQQFLNPAQLVTHPSVSNVDVFSGAYSISYKKK